MGNIFEALRAGWNAAYAAFSGKILIPRENNGYESKSARIQRYSIWESYADNEQYTVTTAQSITRKLQNKLYTNIRAIMNACPRVVDLFAYYVYVGNIDMEHLTGGAIPLVTDNEQIKNAVRQLFKWSNWNAMKELYVRNGATYGDSAIKIVDDREHRKVYLEPLHPSRILDVELDSRCNVKSIVIEYMRDEEPDLTNVSVSGIETTTAIQTKTYRYTEVITSKTTDANGRETLGKFRTFKDGKPYAFYNDASGKPVSEWDNEYGFVPVVMVQHSNTGLKWGANAFYKTLRKIDELNDVSSLLNDQIRKIIIPLLAAIGIKKKRNADGSNDMEMDSTANGRDTVNIVYMPKETDLKPIQTQIDIAAVTGNNGTIGAEIENDLPILALQQIRGRNGDLTQPGIEAAYSDAIASVKTARANYDLGLIHALQMGMTIGGYNGYEGFEGITMDSYDSGELEFTIADRPVIGVGMSQQDILTNLSAVNNMAPALQRLALQKMGFSDQEIDDVVQSAEEQMRNAVRGLADSVFNTQTIPGKASKGKPTNQQQKQVDQPQQMALPAMAGN